MHPRIFFSCTFAFVALTTGILAQTAQDYHEGLRLDRDNTTESFTLSWWGRANFIYFVEHSDDLKNWNYVPISRIGADEPIHYGFTSNADRAFFRLKLTNDPTSSIWKADFDGDGVCNGDEILAGEDPFAPKAFVDSDNDGLPDYWEMLYFGNLSQDGEGSFLGDGISNREKYQNGINPTVDEGQLQNMKTEYSYDATGRLIKISAKAIQFEYALDSEGNILNAE